MTKTTFNVKNIKNAMKTAFDYDMTLYNDLPNDASYKSLIHGLFELYIAGFLSGAEWKKISDYDKQLWDMMVEKNN